MAAQIQPIWPHRNQYRHTVKHLYDPNEKWDLIIQKLPHCRAVARKSGCTDFNLNWRSPHAYDRACCEACRVHVLADHDAYYAPAYFAAIAQPQESLSLDNSCTGIVGKNGVLTIVSQARAVRTAYRVVPIGPSGTVNNDDFIDAGRWQLHDLATQADKSEEANMTASHRWKQMVDADLEPLLASLHQGTLSASQAYRLLVLLGRSVQLGASATQLAQRLRCKDLQHGVSELLMQVTLPDPTHLLDILQANLRDDDEPQGALFGSLINVDNLVTIWELSGQRESADRLARSAAARVLRHPETANALGDWALRRLDSAPGNSPVRQLWQAIAQEVTATAPRAGNSERFVPLLHWQPVTLALQAKLAAPRLMVTPFGGKWFDCYSEGEELIVQIRLPPGQRVREAPQLSLVTAEGIRRLPVKIKEQKPGSVWLSLGTEEQLAKSLGQAREALGVTTEQLESVHIQLELEPEPDAKREG